MTTGASAALSRDTAASRIFVSHTGCRGTCPIYELTLFPNGQVVYNGIANVATVGIAQSHIHPDTYEAFLLDFERIGFFSIGECPLTPDVPGTTTTVAGRGKSKTVHHTGSCPTEPPLDAASSARWTALTDLEARIEATVNSKQWTGR